MKDRGGDRDLAGAGGGAVPGGALESLGAARASWSASTGPAASGGRDPRVRARRRVARGHDRLAARPGSRRSPTSGRSSAALGIAYVQRARITADPSAYPIAQAALRRSLALQPKDNTEALVGLGPWPRPVTISPPRSDWGRRAGGPLRSTPTSTVSSATPSSSSGATERRSEPSSAWSTPVPISRPTRGSATPSSSGERRRRDRAMRAASDVAAPADAAWAAAQVGKLHFGAGRSRSRAVVPARAVGGPRSMDARPAWRRGMGLGRPHGGDRRLRAAAARYPSPEHVVALGDLYAAAGEPEVARRSTTSSGRRRGSSARTA